MNQPEAPEPQRLVSEAMAQVAEDRAAIQQLQAQRQAKSRKGLLTVLSVTLGLVLVWDAWMIWRPPRLPPAEQQT